MSLCVVKSCFSELSAGNSCICEIGTKLEQVLLSVFLKDVTKRTKIDRKRRCDTRNEEECEDDVDEDTCLLSCSLLDRLCLLFTKECNECGHVCHTANRLLTVLGDSQTVKERLVSFMFSESKFLGYVASKTLSSFIYAVCYAKQSVVFASNVVDRLLEGIRTAELTEIVFVLTFLEHFHSDADETRAIESALKQCHAKRCRSLVPLKNLQISSDSMQCLVCNLLEKIPNSCPFSNKPLDSVDTVDVLSRLVRVLDVVIGRNREFKDVLLTNPLVLINCWTYSGHRSFTKDVSSVLYKVLDYLGTSALSGKVCQLQYRMAVEIVTKLHNVNYLYSQKTDALYGFGGQFPNANGTCHTEYANTDSTLQCIVLLNLSCLAILSHFSFKTTGQERLLSESLQNYKTFCERRQPSDSSILLSSFLVTLFVDQDDLLIEALFCSLEIATNLKCFEFQNKEKFDLEIWNPHKDYYSFLHNLGADYRLLLDLLISNETCFLHYLVKYLKLAISDAAAVLSSHEELTRTFYSDRFERFLAKSSSLECSDREKGASVCQHAQITLHSLESVVLAFRKLFVVIQTQMQKELFPYNAKPLMSLLKQFCDSSAFSLSASVK